MDGHTSHTKSINGLELARANHVPLVQLPAHCTHKMQPLDVGFFFPLGKAYAKGVQSWQSRNPGIKFTTKQFCSVFSEAYEAKTTIAVAKKAFEACGIWPVNKDVFKTTDFAKFFVLPAQPEVTVPLPDKPEAAIVVVPPGPANTKTLSDDLYPVTDVVVLEPLGIEEHGVSPDPPNDKLLPAKLFLIADVMAPEPLSIEEVLVSPDAPNTKFRSDNLAPFAPGPMNIEDIGSGVVLPNPSNIKFRSDNLALVAPEPMNIDDNESDVVLPNPSNIKFRPNDLVQVRNDMVLEPLNIGKSANIVLSPEPPNFKLFLNEVRPVPVILRQGKVNPVQQIELTCPIFISGMKEKIEKKKAKAEEQRAAREARQFAKDTRKKKKEENLKAKAEKRKQNEQKRENKKIENMKKKEEKKLERDNKKLESVIKKEKKVRAAKEKEKAQARKEKKKGASS